MASSLSSSDPHTLSAKRIVLPSELPEIAPPPRVRKDSYSIYSMEADHMLHTQSQKTERLRAGRIRGHQRTPSLPVASIKIVKQSILCRICDEHIQGHLFTSHTELCSIKTQWEVRSLECDNYLGSLYKFYTKSTLLAPSSQELDSEDEKRKNGILTVTNIIKTASELSGDSLKSLPNKIEQLQSLLASDTFFSFVDELINWLNYKISVWKNIANTEAVLKTLIGFYFLFTSSLHLFSTSLIFFAF